MVYTGNDNFSQFAFEKHFMEYLKNGTNENIRRKWHESTVGGRSFECQHSAFAILLTTYSKHQ